MSRRQGVCVRCDHHRCFVGRRLCERCHREVSAAGELDWYRNPNDTQIQSYRELLGWGVGKREAAERLGVTDRTIERYRARLRLSGELPPRPDRNGSQIDAYRKLLAHGDGRFGNRSAAERLGLTKSTIVRYRARLRRSGELEELER